MYVDDVARVLEREGGVGRPVRGQRVQRVRVERLVERRPEVPGVASLGGDDVEYRVARPQPRRGWNRARVIARPTVAVLERGDGLEVCEPFRVLERVSGPVGP